MDTYIEPVNTYGVSSTTRIMSYHCGCSREYYACGYDTDDRSRPKTVVNAVLGASSLSLLLTCKFQSFAR